MSVLSPEERRHFAYAAQRVAVIEARTSPASFIPQAPTAKQAEFLAFDGLEALYGGAAGGGKSSALLMAALQYVHVPGYAALILRRTYADLSLPGAIMDRAHEWLQGTGATWNGTEKRWTFPSERCELRRRRWRRAATFGSHRPRLPSWRTS